MNSIFLGEPPLWRTSSSWAVGADCQTIAGLFPWGLTARTGSTEDIAAWGLKAGLLPDRMLDLKEAFKLGLPHESVL